MTSWKLTARRIGRVFKRTAIETINDNLVSRAAELSYYFLLALFPLLLFMTSVLGLIFGENSELQASLLTTIRGVLPHDASRLVGETVQSVTENAGGGKVSFGLLLALWAASNGMGAITECLNEAYDVKETRSWWRVRLRAIALTLALAVFILISLALLLGGDAMAEWLNERYGFGAAFERAWMFAKWPVSLFFTMVGFGLIYRFAPNVPAQRIRDVAPGVIIGLAGWLVVSLGLQLYLRFFNTYDATYGSLGAVIILMLWFYLSGFAVLVGGEFNSELRNSRRRASSRPPQDVSHHQDMGRVRSY